MNKRSFGAQMAKFDKETARLRQIAYAAQNEQIHEAQRKRKPSLATPQLAFPDDAQALMLFRADGSIFLVPTANQYKPQVDRDDKMNKKQEDK